MKIPLLYNYSGFINRNSVEGYKLVYAKNNKEAEKMLKELLFYIQNLTLVNQTLI